MKYTNFIPIDLIQRRNSRETRVSKNNWTQKISFIFTLLLCFSLSISAQEIWTGATDGDWTKNSNWADNTAPLSGIIVGSGVLTISAGAANAPTTNLPATITAKQLVVMSPLTIPTGVTVNVDGSTLTSDGVVTSNTGDLTVLGTLNIDKADMNGLSVGQDGTDLFNLGTVRITNSGRNGVLLTGTGSSVIDHVLTVENSGYNGVYVDNVSALFNNQLDGKVTIKSSQKNGIENAGTVESSGDITIYGTTDESGITNAMTGTFTVDSLGVLMITGVAKDGINTSGTFANDGGEIKIGDGTIGGVGETGVEVVSGTFDNFSTTTLGGGTLTVNGTTGDGILIGNGGTLTNGDNPAVAGDTLGIITIDNNNGNGIQLLDGATLENVEQSKIIVGMNSIVLAQVGILSAGSGVVTNLASTLTLNGSISAATLSMPLMNTGACNLLEINAPTNFAGGLTNEGIVVSTAPTGTVVGAITNTGIIIDPNNSFNSVLTPSASRASSVDVDNTGGIIIAPYSEECYTDTLENFLITGLVDPSTATHLPVSPFTMVGNNDAATLDAANNRLVLNMIQSLMNFDFNIVSGASTCTTTGSVAISFANVVSPAVACNNNIQVSLDASCSAVLTPDVILEGDYDCYDGFKVELLEGANIGQAMLDESYLGQTVQVKVTSPLGNSCWGTVTVESKLPPVLVCTDTTIICNLSTDPAVIGGQPTATNSCNNNVTFTYVDNIENFTCKVGSGVAPDTISKIQRTWRGTDGFGNSTTCLQTIHVVKPQLTVADIIWPENDTLYCGDNPSVAPETTGFPRIKFNGDTVSINQFCSFGLNYTDQEFATNCSSERKILRTWTIFDWCRPSLILSNAFNPGAQLIKVVDTVGPAITDLPFNTELQVFFPDQNSCGADVTVPPVVVSDVCSNESITVTVSAGFSTINTNGGTLKDVPFGLQTITYRATDACGNSSTATTTVFIADNIAPTVICKENIVVSLTQSGVAQVLAQAFDNGSYDNCQLDSMRVRRMDSCGTEMVLPFGKVVDFQCCDVGQLVMVELGVWDSVGNFNSCMVRVQIQDKVTPTLTCPSDVTVTCDTDLTDLSVFGPATASGGACNNTSLNLEETKDLDNCGVGTITRTWTVPNTTVSCTQTITVTLVPNPSFNITRMPQPEIEIQCSDGVDIEALGQDSLQVESSGCQLLAVSYNQRVFNTTGECKEVLRSWEIIDWCQNPTATPGLPGYQVVTQIVKLIDTIVPTFVNTMDTMIVNTDHGQCSATVTLPAFTAVDSCGFTPTVRINGLATDTESGFGALVNAAGGTVIPNVPVGTYSVIYTALDFCNNSTSKPLTIIVQDNQGPSIFCDDLVTTLILKADEADNSDNRGWVTVRASDFNCKITDCDLTGMVQTLRFPSQGIGLNTPPADTSFGWTFNCTTKGEQVGDLWVRDGSGNWDYVRVTIDVQDNMNICPDISFSGNESMISGTIETEVGEKVDEVTVSIGGYDMTPTVTGVDGNYQFGKLPNNSNYTIAPEKNMEPLNGVSTFDLVLISKHILGLNRLDSPYKQIAADINRSGTVTAYDLVQLRQLILNVTTEFANNDSWRFVDANYQFTTENAAAESFAEVASIGNLADNTEAHFVAVKIGDVNTTATANRGLTSSEARTTKGTLAFATKEVSFETGNVFNADFNLANLENVEGYQFTLNVDLSKVEIVSVQEGVAKAANFGERMIKRGQLTTSWNQGAETLQDEERMFSVTLRAKEAGNLSEVINISSELTKAEAYNNAGEILEVSLNFNGVNTTENEFVLHNNKPNPFKDVTTISFDLPETGMARLTIFDFSGRVVETKEQNFAKGYNQVQIEKAGLQGSGIYFYQLETATHTAKKKMILID